MSTYSSVVVAGVANLLVTTPQADKLEYYPKATIVADRANSVTQLAAKNAEAAVVQSAIDAKDVLLAQCAALGIT